MIALGQGAVGHRVTAEGVETAEQMATLSHLGCDEAQGYDFARPLTLAEAEAIVREPQLGAGAGPAGRPRLTCSVDPPPSPPGRSRLGHLLVGGACPIPRPSSLRSPSSSVPRSVIRSRSRSAPLACRWRSSPGGPCCSSSGAGCSWLGARGAVEAGAAAMPRRQRYSGWVTLLADPAPAPGGVEVVVRVGRRHVDLWAHGDAARAIDEFLAGERVEVTGVVRPVPERSRARRVPSRGRPAHRRQRPRIGARESCEPRRELGAPHPSRWRGRCSLAGRERCTSGSSSVTAAASTTTTAACFRSVWADPPSRRLGENVVFVLAAASPLLRRLRLHGRGDRGRRGHRVLRHGHALRAVGASVRRRMAGLAAVAQATGRPASGLRLLALATAGLVLVDPFLIWSVGFRLSVRAVARHPPARRAADASLPRPAVVRRGLGCDVRRGARRRRPSLSRCSVRSRSRRCPRSLLVAPVVGPLMMWGLVAGLPAGLLGERPRSAPPAHELGDRLGRRRRTLHCRASVDGDRCWCRRGWVRSRVLTVVVVGVRQRWRR